MEPTPSANPGTPPSGGSTPRRIFMGPYGLRAGWSLLVFAVATFLLQAGLGWLASQAIEPPPGATWIPQWLVAGEVLSFVVALLAVGLMARIERRSFATYGFPFRLAFGRRFWEGALWGGAGVSAVILMLWLAGGYSVSGLAIHGGELVRYTVLWGLAFLLVALFEELLFRAYPLFTLSRGLGFWPAALILSTVFGALHYFLKPMETWVDGVSTGLLGLAMCFMVRRTGDVWLATGFHFSFNFFALFVYGGSNTGNNGEAIVGHFLDSSFHGPQWLTGGPMGPEASVFIFPLIAALFAAIHLRFRQARYPRLE